MVKTDHILFIASGAFHMSKPSDLIPELQGRLPIRVELDDLGAAEFQRILTETDASLTEQYSALLATEDVTLTFAADGIAAHCRNRQPDKRTHREYWCAPTAHGTGTTAGEPLV